MIVNDTEMIFQIEGRKFHCAMDVTMHFIGSKWKTVVLWYLRNGKKRFSELKQQMPQITEKMLHIQLKQLEEDKLIEREVFGSKPPLKVEYSLTPLGTTLLPLLNEVAAWGRNTGTTLGEMIKVEAGK